MIRAVAIDDEPVALEVIRSHASKVPFLDIIQSFTHPLEAMEYLRKNPVDLLFLDINMPDITGMDIAKSLEGEPLVVFTTAYPEHALAGFELDAVDYLLKPFSAERFHKACNKALGLLTGRRDGMTTSGYLFAKSGYEQIRIAFDDICYLEASGNYINFVLTGDRQYLSRMTLSECENILPTGYFTRIHRSFIVANEKVDRIERNQLHVRQHILPIGEKYMPVVWGSR